MSSAEVKKSVAPKKSCGSCNKNRQVAVIQQAKRRKLFI